MPTVFHEAWSTFEPRPVAVEAFAWHTSPRFGRLADARRLQIDVRSLDPDRFSFPYHFHRAAEEFFLILSGEATLRSPDGFETVTEGDLIFCEEGAEGAHQLYNHGDGPCVYLDVRTSGGLDVVDYPDSGKVAVLPLADDVYERSSQVDYYEGEDDVRSHWPPEVLRD